MWGNTLQWRKWVAVFSIKHCTCTVWCALYLLSPGAVRIEQPQQTKWAELSGLSPAVNTACLPTLLCIWPVCSLAAGLRTGIEHLKLPSSPTQTSWRSTRISVNADSLLLVCLSYIAWFQLTAADVSQLALRPNLNKGRLSQVGHMLSSRLQFLSPSHASSEFCLHVLNFGCHLVLWPIYCGTVCITTPKHTTTFSWRNLGN